MKRVKEDFRDLEILKERQRLRILEQEMKIRLELREIGDRLTGRNLRDTLEQSIGSNSGLAFKLGFMAVNLALERLRNRRASRKKKR